MIRAVMVIGTQAKPRLLKFYTFQPPEWHRDLVRSVFQLLSARPDNVSNFVKVDAIFGPGTKMVYKHLATLYFVFVFDSSENELAMLDLTQAFVETLDRCFKNVCELDILFNFNKLHTVLDEMILGGQVIETSSEQIMTSVEEIAREKGHILSSNRGTSEPIQQGSGLRLGAASPVPAPMGDLGLRRPLTAAEVVGRLKDDGDFDALRCTIVLRVKENEVLRKDVISEVKQSLVLQEDLRN